MQGDELTNTLQDHVHCNGQVNELYGLVEGSSYSRDCWEVYIGCQRTRETLHHLSWAFRFAELDQFDSLT
jgi:hypothetical protein